MQVSSLYLYIIRFSQASLGQAFLSTIANNRIVYIYVLRDVDICGPDIGRFRNSVAGHATVIHSCKWDIRLALWTIFVTRMLYTVIIRTPCMLNPTRVSLSSLSCGPQSCQCRALRSLYLFGRWCRHSKDRGNRTGEGIHRTPD